jgi:hypothetical protein
MFSFCSKKVKPHLPCWQPVFSAEAAGRTFTSSGVWMSGKRPAGAADGFGEPSGPKKAGATIRQ